MGRSKKSNKFGWLFCLAWSAGAAFAAETAKDRFTSIYTLQDERNASVINNNFRRATTILIEDKGFNVSVAAGSTSSVVSLNVAQPDAKYGVFFETIWGSTIAAVNDKKPNSFKVEYSSPSVAAATLDWILVR